MSQRPLLLSILIAASTSLAAQAETPDPGTVASRLAAHVKTLSSDAFEGRAPATPGEQKTVAYIVEQMKAAGLQPGGDLKNGARVWTQDVPLTQFAVDGPLELSVQTHGQSRALSQGKDVAIRAASTNIDAVQFKDVPLVFLGYGVTAPERKWDDYQAST